MPELRRVTARVTVRKGLASQWQNSNPTLFDGELAYESDSTKLKVGDGATPWNELDYYKVGDSGEVPGTFIHDGTIFPPEVNSVNLALKHVQGEISTRVTALETEIDGGFFY